MVADATHVTVGNAHKAAEKLESAMIEGFLEIFPEGTDLLTGLVDVHIGKDWSEVH